MQRRRRRKFDKNNTLRAVGGWRLKRIFKQLIMACYKQYDTREMNGGKFEGQWRDHCV